MNRILLCSAFFALVIGCGGPLDEDSGALLQPLQSISAETPTPDEAPEATAACGNLLSTYTCKVAWSYSEPICPGGIGYGYYVRTQKKFQYGYQLWNSPGTAVNTKCVKNTTTCINTNCGW